MSLADLRKIIKSEKIAFGMKETIKHLKTGTVKKIFLAHDCPDHIKKDILHYSELNNTPIVTLSQPSDELSLICKKNYLINVISY